LFRLFVIAWTGLWAVVVLADYLEGQTDCIGDWCVHSPGIDMASVWAIGVWGAGLLVAGVLRTAGNTQRATTPPPAADATDQALRAVPAERINELDGLRARGVITDEEYAAKRAKIIEEI
jgi:hypothetical protein